MMLSRIPSNPLSHAPPRTVPVGHLLWRVRADLPADRLLSVLENPDVFLARRELQFKSSRVVTVVRVPDLAPGLPSLILRRLNYGKLTHRLRDWVRPTRARRAFNTGLRLEQAAVATPHPVAVAEVRRLGWPLSAYLITEEIPGAKTLFGFLAQYPSPPSGVTRRFAELVARLHDQGFSHRDLKPTNVLLNELHHPFLIDLDGVRFLGRITEDRAAADLARLARGVGGFPSLLRVSGWKFLRFYCIARGGLDARRLARNIAEALRT